MIRPLVLALAVSCGGVAAQQVPTTQGDGAMLRALDKVSGQTTDLTLATGQSQRLGRLNIELRECRYPAGNPAGDAFAAMVIMEEGRAEITFSGWMLASAPALSAMDHPRYDVWVIRCTTS